MKNLSIVVYALAGAGVVALAIAHLAHTVLGVPSTAIRNDALGTAACLTAFYWCWPIRAETRQMTHPKHP